MSKVQNYFQKHFESLNKNFKLAKKLAKTTLNLN